MYMHVIYMCMYVHVSPNIHLAGDNFLVAACIIGKHHVSCHHGVEFACKDVFWEIVQVLDFARTILFRSCYDNVHCAGSWLYCL